MNGRPEIPTPDYGPGDFVFFISLVEHQFVIEKGLVAAVVFNDVLNDASNFMYRVVRSTDANDFHQDIRPDNVSHSFTLLAKHLLKKAL